MTAVRTDGGSLIGVGSQDGGKAELSLICQRLGQVVVFPSRTCQTLHDRCTDLILAMGDATERKDNLELKETAKVITANNWVERINNWPTGRVDAFLHRKDILRGVDELVAQLTSHAKNIPGTTEAQVNIQAQAALSQKEIRELLHTIITNSDDFKTILTLERPHTDDIMRELQEYIRAGPRHTKQHDHFIHALWALRVSSHNLPPISNMTPELELSFDLIGNGPPPVKVEGKWLARENVRLSLVPTTAAQSRRRRIIADVDNWRRLDHPNVARIYGFASLTASDIIYLVSPAHADMQASAYIDLHPRVDRIRMLAEVASGLDYLHKNGVVHGDVRGNRVLVSASGLTRISNFGLVTTLDECTAADDDQSVRWKAIEIVKHLSTKFTFKSDIWSFGMCGLELLTSFPPFPHRKEAKAVVEDLIHGVRPAKPQDTIIFKRGLTDSVWHVLSKCWDDEPNHRPSWAMISAALRHRTFAPAVIANSPTTKGIIGGSPLAGSTSSTSSPARSPVPLYPPLPTAVPEPSSQVSPWPPTDTNVPPSPSGESRSGLFGLGRRISSSGTGPSSFLSRLSRRKSVKAALTARPSTSDGPVVPFARTEVTAPSSPLRPQTSSGLPNGSVTAFGSSGSSTQSHVVQDDKSETNADGHLRVSVPQHGSSKSLDRAFSPLLSGRSGRSSMSTLDSYTSASNSQEFPMERVKIKTFQQQDSILRIAENGSVLYANIYGLMERLTTDSGDSRHDSTFRNTFLLTYKAYTTSREIASLMIGRFNAPTSSAEEKISIQYSVLNFFIVWLERYTTDLPEPAVLSALCEFTKTVNSPPTMVASAIALFELAKHNLQPRPPPTPHPNPEPIPRASEISAANLAAQLTVLNQDILSKIRPADFIWVLREITPNRVTSFNVINNTISSWVSKSVLFTRDESAQKRASKLKYFIAVAYECLVLRNFSSMAAIIVSIESPLISRLKYTIDSLDRVSLANLEEMKHLIDPSRNFVAYRNAVKESDSPHIPFLLVHINDLKLIYATCQRQIEVDGRMLINFASYQRLLERIQAVLHLRESPYDLEREQGVLAWLQAQIRSIPTNKIFDDQLEAKSLSAYKQEKRDHVAHTIELERAGFIKKKR